MSKQITKTYLEYLGVTEVTADGKVFTKNGELKPYFTGRSKNYPSKQKKLVVELHNSEKYQSVPKEKRNSSSGRVRIYIHQIVYAWFNGEIPYGKELHHKDGNCLNNNLDNLVALTHSEHVKEHRRMRELERQEAIVEEKCRLDIPREHYVKKIEEYMSKADYANANQYKRRLKYYDNHIQEAQKLIEFKKDLMELKAWKKVFKENDNKKLWKQCCTIEKIVKEKGLEARPVVQHALDVCHKHFGRE